MAELQKAEHERVDDLERDSGFDRRRVEHSAGETWSSQRQERVATKILKVELRTDEFKRLQIEFSTCSLVLDMRPVESSYCVIGH